MARKFSGWEKVELTSLQGEHVKGIAPVVISASRSTDLLLLCPLVCESVGAGILRMAQSI